MQYSDDLAHAYERLQELDVDRDEIKRRVMTDSKYTSDQYKKDLDLYKAKKAYLEERLKVLLNISVMLKRIKNNPSNAQELKTVENPDQWKVFEDNLKEYQWIPFEGECCNMCGRTQTSTTAIAAAILTSGKLDIICSRCFKEQLENSICKSGDMDATS